MANPLPRDKALRARRVRANRGIETLETRRLLSAFSTVAAFGLAPQGLQPQSALIADGTGNLYGMAATGGTQNDGTVFELASGSSTITKLADFDGSNGQKPLGGLLRDSNGDLFGATNAGGANGMGTVFEITEASILSGTPVITVLGSFDGTNGANPDGTLILDAGGDLLGTTTAGGANGDGAVFEVAASGIGSGNASISVLGSFDGTNGSAPQGALALDHSGNLFGAASGGGASGDGDVFELAHGSSTITAAASFDGTNGQSPVGGVVIDGSGNLFGVTNKGGANSHGAVYELPSGSSTINALASFDGADGELPQSGVILDGSGNLFGTVTGGGDNSDGTVFEVVNSSNAITKLTSFDFTNGAFPEGAPVLIGSNLFGTTSEGGADALGEVFELAQGGGTPSVVASFTQAAAQPVGTLLVDGSGNVFGAASSGDSNNAGAIFEIPAGTNTINTLASFGAGPAQSPGAGLVMDSSGDLFGVSSNGGTDGDGTVYELVHGQSTITTLASFLGANGNNPEQSGLVLDGNGDLFGTTESGGTHDDGTVFEVVNGSTTITALASFNNTNGANPFDGVIIDGNGNLFGTAESGGGSGLGEVFEVVNGSNAITMLASFDGTDGEGPSSGLAIDSSGDLFGTTQFGGPNNDGTIFEIVNGSSTVTMLASFDGTNGDRPLGSLFRDGSGNLFGTADLGGQFSNGTVFELTSGSSTITTIYSVSGSNDGENPQGGVVINSNGDIFGTANGGIAGGGTVFDLLPIAAHLVFQQQPTHVTAGTTIAPAVTVTVDDANGHVITADSSVITLVLKNKSGPAGAILNGTLTEPVIDGVATFSNLVLDGAGAYRIRANDADSSVTPINSVKFTITAAAASQIVFGQQPTTINANSSFNPSIVLDIEDQFGNLVLTDNSKGRLKLKIKSGPSSALLVGKHRAQFVNGQAVFSNLTIDAVGSYRVTATDTIITSIPSVNSKKFITT